MTLQAPPTKPPRKPSGLDCAELLRHKLEPPNWQIDGLCERGDLMVFAAPGSHCKTYLSMNAAIALTSGNKVWGGLDVLQTGRVAYVDAEMSVRKGHRYLHRVCGGLGVTPEDIEGRAMLWPRSYKLDDEASFAKLLDELTLFAGNDGLDLVILDTLRRFLTGSENDSEPISRFFERIKELQAHLKGPTMWVNHHNRKASKEDGPDPADRLRGSSDIRNAVDTMLMVDSKQDGRLRILNPKHRTGELRPFVVRMDGWPDGGPKTDADYMSPLRLIHEGDVLAAVSEGSRVQAEVAAFLDGRPDKRATRPEIIAALASCSERSINNALRSLKDQGLAEKTDTRPTVWYLADLVERSLLED